jgi:hypothetical protein
VLTASARSLAVLAALVWYVGGIVLLLKGGVLLSEAEALEPKQTWPWVAIVAALSLGSLKARFIFSRSCRRNLERISALEPPRLWQFFSYGFLTALAIMIGAGAALSRLAHGSYGFLIGVATLDLSISIALLGSSVVFWRQKAFARRVRD